MLWIGLTGGLGTGKSTVAEALRRRGHLVIDADELARLAVSPGQPGLTKVLERFGADCLLPSGEVDRRKLAAKVFGRPVELEALEQIVHPIVRQLAEKRRTQGEKEGHTLAFYDVPLLFEKGLQNQFDATVVVAASEENQIARAMARGRMTKDEVLARLRHQLPMAEKISRADFVLHNDGTLKELEAKLDPLLAHLAGLTSPKNIQKPK